MKKTADCADSYKSDLKNIKQKELLTVKLQFFFGADNRI